MQASLYVYYRLDSHFLPNRQMADFLLAEIKIKTGINGRLLRRRDDADTWMEVYEAVSDPAALEAALAQSLSADPRWQPIRRQHEWFVPLA